MKAIIEVPYEVLEKNPDRGFGKMLVESDLDSIDICPRHNKMVVRYTLVGSRNKVNPLVAYLMTLIMKEEQSRNGG